MENQKENQEDLKKFLTSNLSFNLPSDDRYRTIGESNAETSETNSIKVFKWAPMSNSHLTMTDTVIELFSNGNLHISAMAKVSLGRCTGTISGSLSLIFLNANGAILCQINQAIWLNTGNNPLNGTNMYNEILQNFNQIAGAQIMYTTKIEIRNC